MCTAEHISVRKDSCFAETFIAEPRNVLQMRSDMFATGHRARHYFTDHRRMHNGTLMAGSPIE